MTALQYNPVRIDRFYQEGYRKFSFTRIREIRIEFVRIISKEFGFAISSLDFIIIIIDWHLS